MLDEEEIYVLHDTYEFVSGNSAVETFGYTGHTLQSLRLLMRVLFSLRQQFTNEVDFATQMRQTICTAQNISHSYLECQVPHSPPSISSYLVCCYRNTRHGYKHHHLPAGN